MQHSLALLELLMSCFLSPAEMASEPLHRYAQVGECIAELHTQQH